MAHSPRSYTCILPQAEVLRVKLRKERIADDALALAATAVQQRKALISREEQKAVATAQRQEVRDEASARKLSMQVSSSQLSRKESTKELGGRRASGDGA